MYRCDAVAGERETFFFIISCVLQGLRIALAASTSGTDPAALMNAAAAGGAAAAAALAEVQVCAMMGCGNERQGARW